MRPIKRPTISVFRTRLVAALALLVLVYMAGVLGFKFISGYNWLDAIYMTVITITTVGFKEVQPLDPMDKVFTSLLILTSIFILGYAVTVITEYVLSKNNLGNIIQKRVEKKIQKIHNHVVVCGYGRNGQQAVHKLKAFDKPFVIIEKDEEVYSRYSNESYPFIHGNASEDEILKKAGIEKASTLICALPSDADNLFIVLSVRQIKKDLKIISRATDETTLRKLKLAGADNVIMPDKIGGEHMAALVVQPDLIEFLDNLTVSGDDDSMFVEQVPFKNVCPSGIELAISDLDIRKKTGCSVIGYKTSEGEYIVNPDPTMLLKRDSKLILIGRPQQIDKLKQVYHV